MDSFDKDTRSRIMSHIKGKDTKPELMIRSAIHKAGFRYRVTPKGIIGHPDIVLPKYKAIIFVNGCFWHGHVNCTSYKPPKSNIAFWKAKISRNRKKDRRQVKALIAQGCFYLFVI